MADVEISRRALLVSAATSVVVLGACSSRTRHVGAAPPATDDNPVIGLSSTIAADESTVGPTTLAPSDASTLPPTTMSDAAAPTMTPESVSTVAPVSAPGPSLPQALPVPAEGTEKYLQIGTMQIPAIGIDMPLGEGVTLTNLNHGPGHWPGTALPGALGNAVVGGHRVSHTHPFRDLDKLNPGDVVTMTVATGTFTYTVVSTEIVLPTTVRVLDQTNAYSATLFACNPKGQTTQRIIVHLQMSPNPP